MNIIQHPSPNFSSRGIHKPEVVTIHCTDGTYPSDLNYLCNPNPGGSVGPVSSHFYVAPDGGVYQLVDMNNTAWANGRIHEPTVKLRRNILGQYLNPNLYTIPIEVSLRANEDLRPAQETALKELLNYISTKMNIPLDKEHVWGHKQIYSLKSCPGRINISLLIGETVDKEAIKQQIRELLLKL